MKPNQEEIPSLTYAVDPIIERSFNHLLATLDKFQIKFMNDNQEKSVLNNLISLYRKGQLNGFWLNVGDNLMPFLGDENVYSEGIFNTLRESKEK